MGMRLFEILLGELTMAGNSLADVLAEYPTLTDCGFRKNCPCDNLPNSEDAVLATRLWIYMVMGGNAEVNRNEVLAMKTINSRDSSYYLKHIASRHIGYMTNGVFIAAMILQNYRVRIKGGNGYFNLKKRSVNWTVRELDRHDVRRPDFDAGDPESFAVLSSWPPI